jgi:4-hydroxybenzoate polyprenyltransferase
MNAAPPAGATVQDPRAQEREFLRLDPDAMANFVRRGEFVPASFVERAQIVLMLGRPRTCVPNLLAYALGFSYTGADASLKTLAGAWLACCIGFAANLHNAAVELEEDSRNLPGRVWLVAKCGHRRIMLFWRLLIAAMMVTAIALGMYFAIFMALAIVGLHQYSAPPVRSKGRPLLGLWVFAQTVVFPFLFGWTTEPGQMLETLIASIGSGLFGGEAPPAAAAHTSFRYLGMWAFLTLWFMAKGAFKNVPDFEGDRAAGVRTSATEFGTQRRAALVAALATILAYLTLVPLWALGLEAPRALFSLVWLVPVGVNCLRLVRAVDGRAANAVLRADMRLSTAFLATLLLLIAPSSASLVMIAVAAALLFFSDLLGLDSRREVDALGSQTA